MAKRVQILRHTSAEAAAFIGLLGELTLDIDAETIHLHDGATPGGTVFRSTSSFDSTYQAKNTQLDKISALAVSGIVVLRNATAASVEITGSTYVKVTNGDGQSGDPVITLQNLGANALTDGTAGLHDVGTGSGEIPLNDNLESVLGAAAVPVGGIIMWSGAIANIPANWQLCDGTNGTPNLTNKFIVGADADVGGVAKTTITGSASVSGGSLNANTGNAGGHDHGGGTGGHALTEAEMFPHRHYMFGNQLSSTGAPGSGDRVAKQSNAGLDNYDYALQKSTVEATIGITSQVGSGSAHAHSITGVGDHNHTLSMIQPYYALAFIRRMA